MNNVNLSKFPSISSKMDFGYSVSPRIAVGLQPTRYGSGYDNTPSSTKANKMTKSLSNMSFDPAKSKNASSSPSKAKRIRMNKWYKPPITRQASGKTPRARSKVKKEIEELDSLINKNGTDNDTFSIQLKKLVSLNVI